MNKMNIVRLILGLICVIPGSIMISDIASQSQLVRFIIAIAGMCFGAEMIVSTVNNIRKVK